MNQTFKIIESRKSLRRYSEKGMTRGEKDTIAAQNEVVADESMGSGSRYIGGTKENYETHKEMFNLPDSFKDLNPTIRFEKEFERMYSPFSQTIFKSISLKNNAGNLGPHMFARKYESDYSKEMNRSMRDALRQWQRGNS